MRPVGWALVGFAAGIAATASASILGAEGRFSSLIGNLDWESGCTKPYWPPLRRANEGQITAAKYEYDGYQDCLVRRAKADTAYASNAVYEGAKKELRAVQSDGEGEGWTFR